MRRTLLVLALLVGTANLSHAQTGTISPRSISPAPSATSPAGWEGWAQCQVDTQGTDYIDRQTHTWVLAGTPPTMQGVFAIHAATWSAVGSGTAKRTSGSQPLQSEWTTNVNGVSAPLAITVRASDKHVVIRIWHDRLFASAAIKGSEQATTASLRPSAPTPLGFQAWESTFPTVEGAEGTVISGSSTLATNGTTAPMQPLGATRTTSCTWQFAQAPTQIAGPPAPPSLTPTLTMVPIATVPTVTRTGSPSELVAPAPATAALGTISGRDRTGAGTRQDIDRSTPRTAESANSTAPASPKYTYTYVGQPFTELRNFSNEDVIPGDYTTAMFVTATIELAGDLPQFFNGAVTPVRYSVSDGRFTITEQSPVPGGTNFSFNNSGGHLIGWRLYVESVDASGIKRNISVISDFDPPAGIGSSDSARVHPISGGPADVAANGNRRGVWTKRLSGSQP
jgi:hypothetical protein